MAVKAHTITESFSAASTNPPWLVKNPGSTFTSGQMRLIPAANSTLFSGYEYVGNHVDLINSSLLFEVVSAGDQALGRWKCLLMDFITPAMSAQVLWVIEQGRLKFLKNPPAVFLVDIPYSPTNHRWLRMRADATTYWAECSADGITWNVLNTALLSSLPMSMADCLMWFEAGSDVAAPVMTPCLIDNLNLPPVTALGRPKAYVAGSFQKKPGKRWTGSAWETKPWKTWTGSAWKTLT